MELCDFCEVGELEFVEATPYTLEYFLCPVCDATYPVEYSIECELE